MNRSVYSTLLLAAFVLILGVTGCRKGPKNPTPIPGAGGTVRNDGPYGPGESGLVGPDEGVSDVVLGDANTPLPVTSEDQFQRDESFFADETVYFDFDRSTIKTSEQPKIARVADHLRSYPGHAVKIEGNCDERGTEGYNMALGERRALATREYLVNLGIDANRIFTISFGESNPADPGHTEAAYALNRRADFVLLTPRTQ